jgi:hypothetical protein
MTGFASKRAMAQDKVNPKQELPQKANNDKATTPNRPAIPHR